MRISLNWLNELLTFSTVNLKTLINKLTLGGFEVEESLEVIIDNKKEVILDITATANRADSLSIKGIAQEVAALLNNPYKISQYSKNTFISKKITKLLTLSSNNSNYCLSFIGITVESFVTFKSPKWLKQKLVSADIIPVNNLLDFQNYILLETGYPFEFYDLDKIKSKLQSSMFNLKLRFATNKLSFFGNNQIKYNLTTDVLVFKANNEILSIAGIISNNDFQYTSNTKSLLIEGSIFNSKIIRQTSRLLGLRTHRSARYEKGLNNERFVESLWRLLYLLKVENPNNICKIHTIAQNKINPFFTIVLKYENTKEILGPILLPKNNSVNFIELLEISQYLTRLQLPYIFNKTSLTWTVEIPISRRNDLTREIDLVEEIGRLHGFNNFITVLPKIKRIGNQDFSYQVRKKITYCLINEGLTELIHYSLIKKQQNNTIKLINPLFQDCSVLRNTLFPNLLKAITNNLKQGNSVLNGFEFGHVFSGNISFNYQETEQVSGIFGGIEQKNSYSENFKLLEWPEAKGKLENIFDKLNLLIYWRYSTSKIYENLLHPFRTSKLYLIDGRSIGIFGQIHPILAKQLTISSTFYLFEFNFEMLKNELKYHKLSFYQSYSSYPKIVKDLSFIVDQKTNFEKVKNVITLVATKYLVSIELLDEYKGNSIPARSTSLCVQLTFRSFEKTLLNKEIEDLVTSIKFELNKSLNAIARI